MVKDISSALQSCRHDNCNLLVTDIYIQSQHDRMESTSIRIQPNKRVLGSVHKDCNRVVKLLSYIDLKKPAICDMKSKDHYLPTCPGRRPLLILQAEESKFEL